MNDDWTIVTSLAALGISLFKIALDYFTSHKSNLVQTRKTNAESEKLRIEQAEILQRMVGKYIEQLDERTSEIRELEDKWNKLLARVKHLEVRELELLQIISSLEKRVKELEEENLQLMRGTT